MIIFTNKNTGEIVGTIDGRVHSEAQLKMWIGDKDKTERHIIEFKKIKEKEVIEEVEEFEQAGIKGKEPIYKKVIKKVKRKKPIWGINHSQKDLFDKIFERKDKLWNYKFNSKTKKFIKYNKNKAKLHQATNEQNNKAKKIGIKGFNTI